MPEPYEKMAVYPWLRYKNSTFWSNPPLLKHPEEHFRRTRELESRHDDVLLCTTAKSGTHWLHEIISMLLSQTTDYNSKGPFLDQTLEFQEIDAIDALQGQRLMHSHLPLSFLPIQHIKNRRKIVYLNRNPKDRHVSMFHFLCGKLGVPENFTWSEYFNKHVVTDDLLTGWFNYTREMTLAVQNKSANIIQVLYEDLVLNPKDEILKLAQFLEVPYTEEFVSEVAIKCKFDKLKEHKIDVAKFCTPDGATTIFRKGVIGDWKNWFTVAQNELFDDIYKKEMENVNVEFTFENPVQQ